MGTSRSPNVDRDERGFAVVRVQTRGIVLHATRGGATTIANELAATLDWFGRAESQVSAHSVVGDLAPLATVTRVVDPTFIAWHCRARNAAWLGLELVQPNHGDVIPAMVLDAAAWECANWVRQFTIPVVWSLESGFCEHWETPEGQADGKTDLQAPFDRDDFLRRVKGWLG